MEKQIRRFILPFIIVFLVAFGAVAQDYKSKVIPFNGKLIQSDDPTQIGTNFQTLQNLRYTDSHIQGIGGMTKINTTALSVYPHVRNAFHFNKNIPQETHALLHAFSSSDASPVIIQLTATIPETGNVVETTPLVTLTSSNDGFFASVPGDNVIFANGDITYIWGGNEAPVSAFLTSSTPVVATVTNSNDYTEILSNAQQTADQVATLSAFGGIDTYTKLLLHFDGEDGGTTFTDSSGSTRIMTTVGDTQIDTAKFKFGTASGLFDGSTAYITTPDHADFDFAAGDFTIETWVNLSSVTDDAWIASKYGAVGHRSWYFSYTGTNTFDFSYSTDGTNMIDKSVAWTPVLATWYHVAIVRNGNDLKFFVDGTQQGATQDVTGVTIFDSDSAIAVGGPTGNSWHGWLDEFRISKGVARWTSTFTPLTQAYGNASNYFLVGSKRPLQGVKVYVSSANTVASTMTVKEWQGASWETFSVTDNTDTGATLATTGTITWTATGQSVPRYINGLSLYWTQFSFDAGQTSLYYVTVDAPMQSITNIWDGVEQFPIKTLKYDGTTYKDYSIAVADESQATYADFSSLNTSHYIYVGFIDPQQALDVTFVAGSENSTAATTMTAQNWNGSDWQAVGALNDGTKTTTTSFSKGGVISWQGAVSGTEFQTTISNEVPLYYYRLSFAVQLDADVKVSEIRGIPYPQPSLAYTFPAMYQSRAILLNESSRDKNKLLYSAFGTSDVFIGEDTGSILVGDSSEITGACTLSLVLTSALEQLIITKKNQTYRLFGNGPENWELQLISGTTGCVAPKTMKTVSLPLESQTNYIGRHIAIWQGSDGIYVSDGRTPSPIHQDIKQLFDKRLSTSINLSKIADSVGFVDQENLEYHWLFASGTSTTLDKEYVFDLRRWKWYEVVRGSGKRLQAGFKVTDTYGNNFTYGNLDTGYIERLEYGNDFDGGNIVHTVQFGDISLADSPMLETRAQYANLSMVAKTTTTNLVNYTHYVDTSLTGTTITMSPVAAGKRIANVVTNINSTVGVFHSPKLTMTTNNESIGFEPLYLGYFYKVEREHLH